MPDVAPSVERCPECGRELHAWEWHYRDDGARAPVCLLCIGDYDSRQRFIAHSGARARDWTFDTFPTEDVAGRRALKIVRRWVAEPDHYNLWIDGPVGVGKTGLAVSIYREFDRMLKVGGPDCWCDRVEFANVRRLLADARACLSRGESPDFTHLREAHVLILDDLGAERATDYAVEVIAGLVEERHADGNCHVVTSNYSPAQLAKRFGDPVIGQRLVSRLRDDAIQIKLSRRDLRLRRTA
jgi:DNA replication protein DnaC